MQTQPHLLCCGTTKIVRWRQCICRSVKFELGHIENRKNNTQADFYFIFMFILFLCCEAKFVSFNWICLNFCVISNDLLGVLILVTRKIYEHGLIFVIVKINILFKKCLNFIFSLKCCKNWCIWLMSSTLQYLKDQNDHETHFFDVFECFKWTY